MKEKTTNVVKVPTAKLNIPNLRFSEFQGEWEEKKLGEVGKVSMCKRIMKDQTSTKGDIPFYKIGTFGKSPDAFIDELLYQNYKKKYSFPKKGDILISASGTIGRTVIYNGKPAYFQDSNIVWIANDEKIVLNRFLDYCYQNVRWNTEDTTIARLYNNNLRNIIITIPKLEEQVKISNFLNAIDSRISTQSEIIKHQKSLKTGLMQQLFSQQLRFKDDNGADFPDWEEKKLGEVAEIRTGSSNRQDSGLNGEFTFFDRSEDIRTSSIFIFDGEAIIVAGEGSDFAPKYFVGKFDLHQRTYAIMNFINSNGKFLFYYIHYFRQYFLSQAVGSTVKSLRLPMFKKMPVNFPIKQEQTKISNFLSSIDERLEKEKQILETYKQQKKYLLQNMFV